MKQTPNSKPDFTVYTVEGDKAFWTKIGAAWRHRDGDGLNITLTALPLNGRLTIRKQDTTTQGAGQ